MASPKKGADSAAALLAREARALRPRLFAPVVTGIAAALCGVAQAWLVARLLAALLGHGDAGWRELAAAAALALAAAGLGVLQERAQRRIGERAKARLRDAVLARLLAGALADRPVGERSTLAVERVEALEGYFARWIPAAALALLVPLAIAAVAALVDPTSGAILFVAGLLVPLSQALTGIGAAQASRRQFAALQGLSGRFLDRMRGLPVLVLFNQQEDEAGRLAAAAHELRLRTMRVLRLAFLSSGALELLAAGALACIAIRHGAVLGAAHPDPTAALFAILLVPAFFAPLRAFSAAYHERLAAHGAAADLAPLLALPEPEGLLLEEVPPRVTVTFQDVSLRYDPTRPPALDGLSFRVMAGELLLLVGPSGAGKTSALRILMGFQRPDSGRISINGRDITALKPAELRRLTAYVGQRAHLFRATLRENIRFARPDATDAQVEAAALAAHVMEFAETLPEGLDTLVGEGGFGLSGGQAQRVAVARAFLRNAPLVLLDEPTAHLDPGTEAVVLDSLRRLCIGRTALLATHARAARAYAGRVVEIAHGRVAGARLAGD